MRKWMAGAMALLVVAACGCRDRGGAGAARAGATNAPAERSSAALAVDGFTGKIAVEAGQRAKSKIQKIDAAREQDIGEAMKDK